MGENNNTGALDHAAAKAARDQEIRQAQIQMVGNEISRVLLVLRQTKPNDRSEQDRYWAMTITEVEKALAIFSTYIAGQ